MGIVLLPLDILINLEDFVDLDILLRLDVLDLQILLHFMEFLTLAFKHA